MSTAAPATVLVVGHTVLDHRFRVDAYPLREGRTPVRSYRGDVGGPGAVAAMTVVALGGRARLVSRVGADAAGGMALDGLKQAGVDTTDVARVTGAHTAVSAVVVAPNGDRYILPFPGEGLPLDATDVPEGALHGVDAVLVDSRWPRQALAYARAARRDRIPVVVDLDVDDPAMWAVVAAADHAVCDETLARAVGGVETLAAHIEALGCRAAVTLGARGVWTPEETIPAFRVEALDTTGAGDVFHGAFALRLAEGAAVPAALRFAAAAGAVRCATGALPEREAVERLGAYGGATATQDR